MKSFTSRDQMLDAHEAMFGAAGRQAAEIVLQWAPRLFAVPLDPLSIRVVLAPVEMGPYNRHGGYYMDAGPQDFILGNRHQVEFDEAGDLVLTDAQGLTDFIVHELTHARQAQVMKANGWTRKGRGTHRDKGWYTAIAEAAPKYLDVEVPKAAWPKGWRPRKGGLTEPEMTHWPEAIRTLVEGSDPRLGLPVKKRAA
jgi:hypothetical protein